MNAFLWIEPRTPEQAVAELGAGREGQGAAALKAGGVDLLDRMKEGLEAPGRLVNLRRLKGGGLDEIRLEPERPGVSASPIGETPLAPLAGKGASLHVGALVTLARLSADPLVLRHAPALAAAAGGAATPQIRQLATAGGNLLQRPRCWYLRSAEHPCRKKGGALCYAQEGESDFHAVFDNRVCAAVHPSSLATALLAHGARLLCLSAAGPREAPLESLFVSPSAPGADLRRDHALGDGELLTALRVPALPAGGRAVYLKVKQKQSFDWPLAEAAVVVRRGADGRVTEARVVLGAVAPVPLRVPAAEAALLGLRAPDEARIARAAAQAVEGARPLRDNGYKLPLIRGLLARALRLSLEDAAAPGGAAAGPGATGAGGGTDAK